MALDYLEQLCANATAAPWSSGRGDDRCNIVTGPDDLKITVEKPNSFYSDWKDDAEFIAAARTYMPKLIAVAAAAKTFLHYIPNDYAEWKEPLEKVLEDLEGQ